MKKRFLSVLATGLFLFCITGIANAALTTIGTATYGSSDYNLIWDDDNNGNSVIWLDYSNTATNWTAQKTWAAGLGSSLTYNIDSAYTVAWGDAVWRLPSTVDGPYALGWNGTTTAGYNISSSEIGHLFYIELGDKGYYDTNGIYVGDGNYGLNNTGDFNELLAFSYWSGTEYANYPSYAWLFGMDKGEQTSSSKNNLEYGLAVRNGQVLAVPVPVPGAIWLLGSGLAGLATLRKRKKGSSI